MSIVLKKAHLVLYSLWLFSFLPSCSQEKKESDPQALLSKTGQWVSLFNGENLEGWEVKSVKEENHLNFWSVKDGAIVLNSMGNREHDYNWLQTIKEYANFELKLKFQSYRESPGNSGVQIRSRYDQEAKIKGSNFTGWLDGPQIDIHPSGSWRTGFIYDETRGHQRWINPDLPDWNMDKATYTPKVFRHYFADESPHWNELIVVCRGNRIITIVNNIIISDYDGTGVLDDVWHQKYGIDKKGFIALQLHKEDQIKIAFKDIYIKEL